MVPVGVDAGAVPRPSAVVTSALAANIRRRAAGSADPASLLAFLGRVSAQTDPSALGLLLVDTVCSSIDAERGECLLHDDRTQAYEAVNTAAPSRRVKGTTGVIGHATRTAAAAITETLSDDPRYDPDVDGTDGHVRCVCQPILAPDGGVLGVVAVTRSARRPPFSDEDLDTIAQLTLCAAPRFAVLLLERSLLRRLSCTSAAVPGPMRTLPATDDQAVTPPACGHLLLAMPRWLRMMPWLLLAIGTIVLGLVAVTTVPEYASGPGILRPRSKATVTAQAAGQIEWLDVKPGQHVEAGALLGRLRRTVDIELRNVNCTEACIARGGYREQDPILGLAGSGHPVRGPIPRASPSLRGRRHPHARAGDRGEHRHL